MKTSFLIIRFKTFFLLVVCCCLQLVLWAQDNGESSSSSSTTTKSTSTTMSGADQSGNWYAQPWVWIVGAAVFILLLVALLRGNSSDRSEKVTVSKTIRKDSDAV